MTEEQKYPEVELDVNVEKLHKFKDIIIGKFKQSDWGYITCKLDLTEAFMREFSEQMIWSNISRFQKLSEDFMDEFEMELDWGTLFQKQEMSEAYINSQKDKLDMYRWINLDYTKDYTKFFIYQNRKVLRWDMITQEKCTNWGLDFIDKFKDNIVWGVLISLRKDLLTLDFVSKYEKYIKIENVYVTDIDNKLVEEYKEKINFKNIIFEMYKRPEVVIKD